MSTLSKNIPFGGAIEKIKVSINKLLEDRNDREIQALEELLGQNSNDIKILQRLSRLYYRKGRAEDAANGLQKIAELQAKEDFSLKAIETYKNVLKIQPDRVDVNLQLIHLFLKNGMKLEAGNQYRIAISAFARSGDRTKTLELAEELVKMDPSNENRIKLAEIYHHYNMRDEAVKQFEILAQDARLKKNYEKLQKYYEMILPHKPGSTAILKDLTILYLRAKKPDRALHLMEQYKVASEPVFQELAIKSRQMMEALRRQKPLPTKPA